MSRLTEANSISFEDYAAIVQGIASLSARAASVVTPEYAENLARAARDLATVAQSFKVDSLSGVYRVKS